jgi:hypothetical protein
VKTPTSTQPCLQDQEFRFPVALSSSLRMIFIMGVVMKIVQNGSCKEEFLMQPLFDPRCPYSPEDGWLLENLYIPYYPPTSHLADQVTSSAISNQRCHTWLRCIFSPCERYLLAIKGQYSPSEKIFATWVLEMYQNTYQMPNYRLVAKTGARLNGRAMQAVLFHPTRPAVALSLMSITALWRFTLNGKFSSILVFLNPNEEM